ncbi:methyltransferase domain-containing protein [Kovacikia minuta CCNUW1]|uniref:glycosyltransferase family protein n=1 Tax=Kovacikia minuta TaxID=2931930 RepID=UPI001CCADCFD|nr:glycosyltransferase [Kovacikia minuta]UBF26255.1 methyltransferase domain-containing protein [Kovacikia minuta CCNUW1]
MTTAQAGFPGKFLIESSPTPIYQRITAGYRSALERRGNSVIYFNPSEYANFNHALETLLELAQSEEIDTLFIFDNSSLVQFFLEPSNQFVFELFQSFLVFIHHDNIWSSFANHEIETGKHLLEGWQRVKHRSIHFCIESNNVIDLRSMGFDLVHSIFHGSEFEKIPLPETYTFDLSFVGHVLPGIDAVANSYSHLPFFHRIAADYWSRLVSLDREIEPSATAYAQSQPETDTNLQSIRKRSNYQFIASRLSLGFRGDLIKRIDPIFSVNVIGGDPSYLEGLLPRQIIDQKNIIYHPPTSNYAATCNLYASSKINLNITGIQFDHAVVNRVVDTGAVGGFILTDWKADLKKITSVDQEISYRSIEELNEKIAYYLTYENERLEVAKQLHHDIIQRCSYDQLVAFVISKIQTPLTFRESMYIDLGCGTHKQEGFIGVDVTDAPGVDVVADLNQRFPFPDNSADIVRAYDTVEHLHDRIHTMNEIWRICKPNALVDIRVPSTDGRGAFQDPTHISFWNINSFKYYSVEFPAYLELCQSYGFKGAFSIVNLEHEAEIIDDVIQVKVILKAVKPSASPIDSLLEKFNLRGNNLLLCPDWSESEEALHSAMVEVFKAVSQHPDRKHTTLLISQGNFPLEGELTLEEALYTLVFSALLNEGIDLVNEGPELSIIPPLTPEEYDVLFQKVNYRIRLSQEYIYPEMNAGLEKIPAYSPAELQNL